MTLPRLVPTLRWLPVIGAFALFASVTLLFWRDLEMARIAHREAEQFDQVERLTGEIVQLLTDGETGTRGFVLTGRPDYLEPFYNALQKLPGTREELRQNLRELPIRPFESPQINAAIDAKLKILIQTVDIYRAMGPKAALQLIDSGVGKQRMDEVRSLSAKARDVTRSATHARVEVREATTYRATWLAILSGTSAALLLGFAYWRLGLTLDRAEQLSATLTAQEAQYREFATNLRNTHEEERAAMARKVHDEIGQNLTAAKIDIILALRKLDQDPEAQRTRLSRTTELLDQTVQIARNLSMELRPAILDQAGLIAATEWQLREFQTRTGITAHWKPEIDKAHVPRDAKLALFRILQEALTNVARHAQATSVTVRITETDGIVELSIADNGIGVDADAANKKSLGIFGMRERIPTVGGELLLDSAPGHGTRVAARVPCHVEVA